MGRPRKKAEDGGVSGGMVDHAFDPDAKNKWVDDESDDIPYDEDIQHAVDCMNPKECDCGSDD